MKKRIHFTTEKALHDWAIRLVVVFSLWGIPKKAFSQIFVSPQAIIHIEDGTFFHQSSTSENKPFLSNQSEKTLYVGEDAFVAIVKDSLTISDTTPLLAENKTKIPVQTKQKPTTERISSADKQQKEHTTEKKAQVKKSETSSSSLLAGFGNKNNATVLNHTVAKAIKLFREKEIYRCCEENAEKKYFSLKEYFSDNSKRFGQFLRPPPAFPLG